MTKHLRFLFVMLLAMIWSAGWAQTTIWSEDWGGRKADTQPKDIMYDNVVYDNTSDYTKIYNEERAGGSAPELLLYAKKNPKDTWTVTINDLKGCSGEFSLSLYTNNDGLSSIKVNGTKVALSAFTKSGVNRTATFTVAKGSSSLKLEFSPSSNTRIDNVVLTATSVGESKTATNVSFGTNSNKTFTFTEGKYSDDTFTTPTATETTGVAGTIAYSSSNATAISVDASTGALTFLGYGEATITATFTPTDAETYAVSTDWYKVKNKRSVVEGTITFDNKNGAFASLGSYNANSRSLNFISDSKESFAFECTNVRTGDTYKCLQMKRKEGKIVSPTFSKFTNGYKVYITYSSSKALTLSVGDTNEVGTTTSTNNTNGLGADVSISVPVNGQFIVTAGDAVTYISKIEIIPNKVDETTAITLNENSESNTIEAKTGVNVTLKRTMVKGEWNTICLPFDVTEKQAKAAFGNDVKIVELDTEAAVDANVLSFKDSKVILAATPYLIKPSAVSETGTYTFEGVDIAKKNINDNNAYSFNLLVDNPISFKGIYNKVDITEDVQKSFKNNYAAFLGAGNKIYKADGSGNKTKGFRAYFAIPNGASASALRVVIDGTATSIKNIDSEVVESNAPVYNLQGQRVNGNNLTPGIYVKAGKKFVVK